MKLNSHVIFLIAIVGIITAGVVGATILNNGAMKQVDFDGTKVSVPSDSNFVKTGDGYADSKYGITIHLFKNNDSVVNFLKSKSGASVVSLKNQPPQSVAFTQGDDTNVLLTNGADSIDIAAKDQGLVSDMANTVVFPNHQKSAKSVPDIPLIFPPPHLEFHRDFYLISALIAQVNTQEFNLAILESNANVTINAFNSAADNNTLAQYTANEFAQNTPSSNGAVNNQNTSLLDNQNVSNVVSSVNSENQNPSNGASGDSGSVASSSNGNSPTQSTNKNSGANSGSASSSSSGGAPANNNQQQKITKESAKNAVLTKYPGAKISTVTESGDYFVVSFKDSSGHSQKVKVDSHTGQIVGNAK